MCVTRVDLPPLFLPGQKFRLCQRSVVAKAITTGLVCNRVLDMCLCDTAGIATDKRLVYGKRQGIITQPASASNIPMSRAKSIQQGSVRCAQDDSHWRTP